MSTAWPITAITRIKAALIADTTLEQYVDSITVTDRYREDTLPIMTRHAIEIIPGAKTVGFDTCGRNVETLTLDLRLVIREWSVTDRSAILLGVTYLAPGTSEIGVYQFAEDIGNALRLNELTGLCDATGMEIDAVPSLRQIQNEDRDRAFYETILTGSWVKFALHDAAQR